jgi:hypothetical protein
MKPKDFLEVFEFINYAKVKNTLKDMAVAAAAARVEDG